MRVWQAVEDGDSTWWVVAATETEALAELKLIEVPGPDTVELVVRPLGDDEPFTLTCRDEPWDSEDPLPEGAVVKKSAEGWEEITAPASSWAALRSGPGFLATNADW